MKDRGRFSLRLKAKRLLCFYEFSLVCLYSSIGMIDIGRLKGFAVERLPSGSRLRSVLLSERDQLTVNDFLAKMDVWVTLINLEMRDS